MSDLLKLIDRYVLLARVAPVAIVSIAPFLLISAWIPFSEWPIKLVAGSGVLVLGAFALAHLARNAGQKIQGPLWASWGGPPTVRMLRHRDTTFKPGSKRLVHQHLLALGIVDHLPSPEEELRDPEAADELYHTCADWLRRKALELKAKPPFDVVHVENVAYGLQRDSFGIKRWGVAAVIVSLVATVAATISGRQPWIELAAELMLGAYIIWGVTEAAMKRAADDYSRRLLDSAPSIPVPTKASPKRREAGAAKGSKADL